VEKQLSEKSKTKFKKGIFIIPSLLTIFNVFCGFYAIVAAINGRFYEAAVAIIIAGFFDILDGRVARLMNSSSEFGVQLDSLADIISFGLAPSILIYMWVLKPFGRLGWMAAFLFVLCGVLRLARFNIQTQLAKSNYFIGLPTPAAAGFIATTVIVTREIFSIEKLHPLVIVGGVYLLAFLMVSTIKYRNFKNLDLRDKKPFRIFLFSVLSIYIIAAIPQVALFLMAVVYLLSGPFERVFASKIFKSVHTVENLKEKHTN
tara:strand:- start:7908 stop:8687 length:780 start_codon:yes stop_codon:yes gene_type:complete